MNIGFLYGLPIHEADVGGSIHGHQLAKNLVNRGHGLFTWYWTDPNSPLLTHFRGRQVFAFLQAIDLLYIRVEWLTRAAQFSLLPLFSRQRIPVVWEINGLPEERRFQTLAQHDIKKIKRRLRRYAGYVDAAICVSEGIARFATGELGVKRAVVIPNGSDPALFRPIDKSTADVEGPLIVAWVGSTGAGWHDLDRMISAARNLADAKEDIQFWIFGDARNLPDNLPDNIVLKGLLPYEQLARELPRADVGLHLYRQEISPILDSSPLKQFDYMASGLALVAQADGQRRMLLEQWRAGVGVQDGQQGVERVLKSLAEDRTRVRQWGKNGRRAVQSYFNWGRVADETTDLLVELVKESQS